MNNLAPRPTIYVAMHPDDKAALAKTLMKLTTKRKPQVIRHEDLPAVVNNAKIYERFCHSYPRFSGDLWYPIQCPRLPVMPGVIDAKETTAWYAFRIYNGASLADGLPKESLDSFTARKSSYVAEIPMFNTCLMFYLEETIWANPAAVRQTVAIQKAS